MITEIGDVSALLIGKQKRSNPALKNAMFAFPLNASLIYILKYGHCFCRGPIWLIIQGPDVFERGLAMPLSWLLRGLPEWIDKWLDGFSLFLHAGEDSTVEQAGHQTSGLLPSPDTGLKVEKGMKVCFLMWCVNLNCSGFLMFDRGQQELTDGPFRRQDLWTKASEQESIKNISFEPILFSGLPWQWAIGRRQFYLTNLCVCENCSELDLV